MEWNGMEWNGVELSWILTATQKQKDAMRHDNCPCGEGARGTGTKASCVFRSETLLSSQPTGH